MKSVEIYCTAVCPYCVKAKRLLDEKGVRYTEYRVDGDTKLATECRDRSGRRTVPQIFIGDTHVGGCDDLHDLERAGKLDRLLQD